MSTSTRSTASTPATPIEETIEALDQLVRQGLVRYVGLSNWAAWQVAKALGIAERRGLARIASLQAYYTLVGRDLEREIVPMLGSEGVGLMVWSPLAGGLLSGKYDGDGAAADGRRASFDFPPVDRDRLPGVLDGAARGRRGDAAPRVAQVALAWLLHQPAVTSVIIGAKRPEQLADNIGAATLALIGRGHRRRSTTPARCRPNIPAGCWSGRAATAQGRR